MSDRPSATRRTRVALRVAGGPGPAYLAAAGEAVTRISGVDVVLVIVVVPRHDDRSSSRRRILDALDLVYERLERLTLPGGPPALANTALALPPGVPTIADADHSARSEAMRFQEVDVLIDLAPDDGRRPPSPPPFGRWRLRYTDEVDGPRRARLSRPRASTGLVESVLEIDLGSTVAEAEVGVSSVQRIGFSRSRDAVYWRASLLPSRRLARLASGVVVPSAGVDQPATPAPPDSPAGHRSPAMPPFGGLVAGLLRRVIDRVLFHAGWIVLVRRRELDGPPPRDLTGFRTVEAPRGRFFADPFVVATPDGPRIYVEDCPDGAHRGRISVLRSDAEGDWTTERVVLDDLKHRAYPHAVRTDAGLLVTPDGGRSGGVDLFVDMGGDRLQPIGRCLVDIPASDPTLLWHDGRYWLFVTVTGHGMSPWDELHLYSAESIAGVWHPHPGNPVVADVRRARPAGRILRTEGGFIRPGQDCSVEYGRRITLSAITSLSTTDYKEHPIGSIEPTGIAGILRAHTYSFDGTTEALDGYRRVRRRPTIGGLRSTRSGQR